MNYLASSFLSQNMNDNEALCDLKKKKNDNEVLCDCIELGSVLLINAVGGKKTWNVFIRFIPKNSK